MCEGRVAIINTTRPPHITADLMSSLRTFMCSIIKTRHREITYGDAYKTLCRKAINPLLQYNYVALIAFDLTDRSCHR